MNLFTWVDYSVVGATLLFSLLIGVYYAIGARNATNEDLLVGGRSMGVFPIACSMLVTYLSAITILGYPAEIYGYGTQIIMTTVAFVTFVPFSIYFFMMVFYKMQLTSVYEYLEYRFQSPFVRKFASFIFIMQMAVFMGVCLFAPSIALSAFMGFKLWQSVIGLGVCATIYTSIGGIKAVVWTDVFQLFMILFGMIAILYKGFQSSGGITRAFEIASKHGRLEFFNFTVDPFMRHNTLNIFLGQGFAIFCLFGTHQPQVQRYCSLPSLKQAIKATCFAVPLNVLTVTFCLIAGLAIFATYAGCDPIATGKISRVDAIVPYFVSEQLTMPGMMGLFTACVFSASLSTLSSGLNSLAAVLYEDFLSHRPSIKKLSPVGQAHLVRGLACGFGILSIGLAFAAENMGSMLAATITAMGALSGPLGAVFAMGLLMPFINRFGAIVGMSAGFVCMVWITTNSFMLNKSHIPLPFSADECPENLNATLQTARSNVTVVESEIEWPEKLYTISYILYPFVGGMITFAAAIIVSIFTGGCCSMKQVEDKYLHPIIRRKKNPLLTSSIVRKFPSQTQVDCLSSPSNFESKPSLYPKGYSMVSTEEDPFNSSDPKSPGVYSQTSQRPLLYRLPSYTKE